jgi:hypothetical protein
MSRVSCTSDSPELAGRVGHVTLVEPADAARPVRTDAYGDRLAMFVDELLARLIERDLAVYWHGQLHLTEAGRSAAGAQPGRGMAGDRRTGLLRLAVECEMEVPRVP